MFNLFVILRETATAMPDHPAVVHDGGQMTCRELDEFSDACAEGLVARGPRPGRPFVPRLPNIPRFPVAYFGLLKAGGASESGRGARPRPASPMWSPSDPQ